MHISPEKARLCRRFVAGGLVRGRRPGLTSLEMFECSIWVGTYHQRRDEYIMISTVFYRAQSYAVIYASRTFCQPFQTMYIMEKQQGLGPIYEAVNVRLILSNGDHVYPLFLVCV